MGSISRDTFQLTNVMHQMRTGEVVADPKLYVGVRLQQGVPLLDADWNELEDIRRTELETLLARAIGDGVPAGSTGFRIRRAAVSENNFLIEGGLIFLDGWLIYNPSAVDYVDQPHRAASGVAPPLSIPLEPPSGGERELLYLDAWEQPVDYVADSRLIDSRVGVETAVRLERLWVVRAAAIAAGGDPLDPAAIPERQPNHRYYPLATADRSSGTRFTEGVLSDLRRTHLTLGALTHPPLQLEDPVRDQRLDSARLAGVFESNRDVLQDVLGYRPEVFVFAGEEIATWRAMTALQDVRAAATGFEQQARNQLLHRAAALDALRAFLDVEVDLQDLLQGFADAGIASQGTRDFLEICNRHLRGSGEPQSLESALDAQDLLGAVMAQERLNEALGQDTDTLPEGGAILHLTGVTPEGVLEPETVYLLTIEIESGLTSEQGAEPVRVIAAAGPGWSLSFQGSQEPDPREILLTIPNQESQDVGLLISAEAGAAATTLHLKAWPERRQQLVRYHPAVTLALGQELLPGSKILATLDYLGPALQPGNVASVPRSVMATGVPIPFRITNLSTESEQYQLTVSAQSDATGWQEPEQPVLAPLAPDESRNVQIHFRITDTSGAKSPLTYRLRLVRVTGGANEPQASTTFDLTFQLQ